MHGLHNCSAHKFSATIFVNSRKSRDRVRTRLCETSYVPPGEPLLAILQAEHRERLSELKQRIEAGKDLVADELDRIASARQHREEATHDLDMVANSLQRQVTAAAAYACDAPSVCRSRHDGTCIRQNLRRIAACVVL